MIPILKIVRQYERLAVFTLGKFNERTGVRGPGLQILIWPFQTGERIDLREDCLLYTSPSPRDS